MVEQDSRASAPGREPAPGRAVEDAATAAGGSSAGGETGRDEDAAASRSAVTAALLAWLIPGAGHLYLGRRGRGILYLVLVLVTLAVGVALEGKLWRMVPGQPLSVLGTLGCAGLGLPYLLLRFVLGYQGDLLSQGYEYGAAFIVTGGLMNLLLVLDAWDIARGVKE